MWPLMSASWTLIPADFTLLVTEDRNLLVNLDIPRVPANCSPAPFCSVLALLAHFQGLLQLKVNLTCPRNTALFSENQGPRDAKQNTTT